ncbi:MAG: hypothetical protein A2X51_02700 [Candidatus Rokubacteria bacterium GWC2_70_24]|nr:MAG: hypothetical protein A2X53_10670 [Candidatus Rokubacteria bacterium GWA2_70_23]OGK92814.1 MAG: hypothetical protein A2X51_02700 [Candidatus Rokubacteria bacterium GWC2_70_24]
MPFCHVAITAAPDYLTRRAQHRDAHLARLMALRASGFVVGGGPAPDGKTADIFYRVPDPPDIARVVEEDPYFKGGVWTAYTPAVFDQFLEPWRQPPLVIDGSRAATIVEGRAADADMADFALVEARGAGRLLFGGFFPGGRTLAVMASADAAEAVGGLAETGFWEGQSLTARPWLYVL